MEYTQLESSQALAWLRARINYRAAVPPSSLPKVMSLSPGKQYALEWRIEAAYRAQAGRQRVSKFMINRLAERLPDDRTGLSEGLIFLTFEHAKGPTRPMSRSTSCPSSGICLATFATCWRHRSWPTRSSAPLISMRGSPSTASTAINPCLT